MAHLFFSRQSDVIRYLCALGPAGLGPVAGGTLAALGLGRARRGPLP